MTGESDTFSEMIRAQTKQGVPYPAARSEAACHVLSGYEDFDADAVRGFLSSPNNILAIEYEKAIAQWNAQNKTALRGHGIRRIGEGYHSTSLTGSYASATAIRTQLLAAPNEAADSLAPLRAQVPSFTCKLLNSAKKNGQLLTPDDFSEALYTRLWSLRETGYEAFADCSAQLSHRIAKNLDSFLSFTQFAEFIKSRDLTYTRVCRALLHILLDIRQSEYPSLRTEAGLPYLRVLGFRKDAAPLLSSIKKEASAPLVTKVADAPHILSATALPLLQQDIRCADLYRSIASMRCGKTLPTEYTQGLVLL
jgi:predicted nucleotidyltransferase